MRARAHTHTHTHACMHACMHVKPDGCSVSHLLHRCSGSHLHQWRALVGRARAPTHPHTYTHTHTHTHTYTHTHTHTSGVLSTTIKPSSASASVTASVASISRSLLSFFLFFFFFFLFFFFFSSFSSSASEKLRPSLGDLRTTTLRRGALINGALRRRGLNLVHNRLHNNTGLGIPPTTECPYLGCCVGGRTCEHPVS